MDVDMYSIRSSCEKWIENEICRFTKKKEHLTTEFEGKEEPVSSVTRRKLSNVYKSRPKMISLEKWKILTPQQNLPKNVGDLGKSFVAKGFKKLPKVQ